MSKGTYLPYFLSLSREIRHVVCCIVRAGGGWPGMGRAALQNTLRSEKSDKLNFSTRLEWTIAQINRRSTR